MAYSYSVESFEGIEAEWEGPPSKQRIQHNFSHSLLAEDLVGEYETPWPRA